MANRAGHRKIMRLTINLRVYMYVSCVMREKNYCVTHEKLLKEKHDL